MQTPGKALLRSTGQNSPGFPRGRRLLTPNGKAVLVPDAPCTPFVLASAVTNTAGLRIWDLRPYQGRCKAPPCTFWRLIEVAEPPAGYPAAYPWYGADCVDPCGKLVNLPNQFTTTYDYDGFMELQIGCLTNGTFIQWPPPVQTLTARITCF